MTDEVATRSAGRLHADEIESDAGLARRLVARAFPAWAGRPVRRVVPGGTDHAIYRLGDDLAVRLPRRRSAAGQAIAEARWLPFLAPYVPLAIPEVVAVASPSEDFPWPWSVTRWIEGEPIAGAPLADPAAGALALGAFVRALGAVAADGAPVPSGSNGWRGRPLRDRDEATRRNLAALRDTHDEASLAAIWEASLRAPEWEGAARWVHGDLLPVNLLGRGGRLVAAIDWGCLSSGDPATDLMAGWVMFEGAARAAFREASGCDDATWARGRGWALSWAAICLPYYRPTGNPLVPLAERTLAAVLEEWRAHR